MPALNIEFSPEDLERVREAAARENVSLRRFSHGAIMAAVDRRTVADVAASVAQRSAELNERLAR